MEDGEDRYDELLRAHLNVNPKSWAALEGRGVDEETPLRLDFQFTAPGETEIRSLMRFLRTTTDYEFQGGARNQEDGSQRWMILGTTPETTWSLDKLNAWVTQMTTNARDHGPAEFDGWGTSPPEPGPPADLKTVIRLLRRGRRKR
jgi:hypothetical protein